MIATIQQVYDFIIAITLGLARIYPCFILVPVFSLNVLKGMMRNAVVIALTLLPAPVIQQQLLQTPLSWPMLPGLLLKEVIVGLLIALILAMPFWLFESVGALFDNQRGALMGGQLNPALGADSTPLGHLLKQLIILLLIIGGGLSSLTQLLWDSYRVWPALAWLPAPGEQGFEVYLTLLAETFTHLVIYAGPLVALLLLLEFSISLLSLYSPQLQVFVLSIPAKCLLGMAFFIVYLPVLHYLGDQKLRVLPDLKHVFPLLFSH
ncbi:MULTISPECIES: type III secretion system export apparatus subunit SctT [unclassified Brenneria]|uniref:type III secretion system export apparatus subunit SctT n=1 Tax=unclassified Brenneria TaxID=2634434 RepID=UPI001557B62C|nr:MULTISPECIES: type III secretion system export apparatus subunit SctT [unclassified Brenneria]MBJ7220905.1 type III secretion system export apparatus subunit SctT [Brenneria sp. L3-3C-1]MEE3642146.1 type III secretion system export apparatus subunit SctT [Brenneria sp. L3_3C_1]MEE3650481.1 type III secretion system export apparatus subunit SctT [Brenneria sp. HEZEL_4_2_4]NPD00437.1 type III secretion system export apparatus subunit SctT [Brenneria sp. hezel4-2-4]